MASGTVCGEHGSVSAFRYRYRDGSGGTFYLWTGGFLLLQAVEKDLCHLDGCTSVCDLFGLLSDLREEKTWDMYLPFGANL